MLLYINIIIKMYKNNTTWSRYPLALDLFSALVHICMWYNMSITKWNKNKLIIFEKENHIKIYGIKETIRRMMQSLMSQSGHKDKLDWDVWRVVYQLIRKITAWKPNKKKEQGEDQDNGRVVESWKNSSS